MNITYTPATDLIGFELSLLSTQLTYNIGKASKFDTNNLVHKLNYSGYKYKKLVQVLIFIYYVGLPCDIAPFLIVIRCSFCILPFLANLSASSFNAILE